MTQRATSPKVRRAALAERFPQWTPRPMHRWLDHIADEYPEREFIVTDTHGYTYRDIRRWSRELAAGLAARGLGKGDHIAVLMGNHPEYVALKFAISRLGAVIVPINVNYRCDELRFLLADSEARALIVMTGSAGRDYLRTLDEMAPGWASGDRPPDLPNLALIVQFETVVPARDGVLTLAEITCSGDETPDVPIDAGDPSVIFYTSGTTGSPKGVVWSHDAEARIAYGAALTRAFADGWRIQAALPLFHVMANNEAMHAAMFVGGAYIPRSRFDPVDFATAIERHRPVEIVTVPTMVVALCESESATTADTGSLVALMCAGAPAPARLWERAAQVLGVTELTTAYGMTETGGAPAAARPESGIEHVSTTVGQIRLGGVAALPGMDGLLAEVATADPVTGEHLPEGAAGELISRGPTNAIGYWKRPDATAETFRDGWVFTGDLGRVTAAGSIVLTGRKKEMIRSGGENFAPKEVEDLLTRHPAVSQAYVVGVPDEKWGESCCAWIVREPDTDVSAEDLIEFCRDKLAAFKRPRQVLFIAAEDLPKTPTGKVQKFVLVDMARAAG